MASKKYRKKLKRNWQRLEVRRRFQYLSLTADEVTTILNKMALGYKLATAGTKKLSTAFAQFNTVDPQ